MDEPSELQIYFGDGPQTISRMGELFTSLSQLHDYAQYLSWCVVTEHNPGERHTKRLFSKSEKIPQATITRVTMESPLFIDLLDTVGQSGLALWFLRQLVNKPESIGGCLQGVRAGYYEKRSDAEQAKQNYLKLKALTNGPIIANSPDAEPES
ncbi:hypothetical protein [Streptomyces platensis]|uniref:hypothetical protein n=1 Tax=Streptomyces platensis TaxID=58346 RepID=UPI002E802C38|nr:hypothetical protein [Streptomyces platensis]WUB80410.1 hypothetical protein OG424_15185 [Streptomyces platensis]